MLNFGLPYGKCRHIRVQNWHIYNKKKVFKFVFNFEYSVYMYIYDVPQLNSCHWELTSWPFDWDLVSYFHILAEGKYYYLRTTYEVKNRARFFFVFLFFFFLNESFWVKSQSKGLEGFQWQLKNWIQVLYFQLKEICPLFSPAKARILSSFFTSLDKGVAALRGPGGPGPPIIWQTPKNIYIGRSVGRGKKEKRSPAPPPQ